MANLTVTGVRAPSFASASALTLKVTSTPTFNAEGSCTLDGTDALQAYAAQLNSTQFWFACRFRANYAYNTASDRPMFGWVLDANNYVSVTYRASTDSFVLERRRASVATRAETAAAGSFASGTKHTVVGCVTAAAVKVAVDGSVFTSTALSNTLDLPADAFLDIGNNASLSDIFWAAAGTGTLADADSVTLNALGDTDPTALASLPGTGTFLWKAASTAYLSSLTPEISPVAVGLLTAAAGPLTGTSGISLAGDRGDTAAAGQAGLTGMFTSYVGPGVNAPFVIGVTAHATATAQPGAVAINNVATQNVAVVGDRAEATATGQAGSLSTAVAARASLVVEVDFVGNATAPYFDQVSQQVGTGAYWRFDNASVLADEVGSSVGTVVGGPTLITGSQAYDTDQQLRFDGTSQYAQVPATSVLAAAGSYSMAGWLRFPTLPSAAKVIFTKGSYRLLTTAANKLSFAVTNDQSGTLTNTTVTTNSTLVANTEYHVVCVHDGDNDELRIYLNGVLDNTATHTAGTEIFGYPLTFAGRPYGAAPSFRNAGTAFSPAGSGQSLFVIPAPTFVQGDLLLAHISQLNTAGTATLTAPSGWNLLSSLQGLGGAPFAHHSWMYWKYAGATEPGGYTWTSSVTTGWAGAVSSFGTVDPVNPFAKPVYAFTDPSSTNTHSTNSHLIDTDNTLVLGLVDGDVSSGANGYVWGSGTERYDVVSTNVPGQSVGMASQAPTAETSVSMTATSSATSNRFITTMLALAGTGIGTFAAVDLDEWSFSTIAPSDSDVAEMYEARLSGVAAWTDVSADARGADLSYGRQYELNRMESGHANITLKNQHRRYDAANTSSIYYPNVKPNRKIRMRALLSGNYYPLWEGLVDRWPSDWGISWNYDEVKLTISDGYKALNRAGVSSLTGAAISGTQLDSFLSRALWPVDKRELDGGEFIMAAETTDTVTSALTVVQDIADSELGQFFINHVVDGSPATFHDRSHRWTNTRSLTSQVTFTDQPGGIRYTELDPSEDDDNVANEWIVTSANGTTGTAIDATSRQQNYPVTGERTTRLDNPDDAIVQARALLQQTARPGFRFDQLTVRLTTQTAAVTWQTMFELAISDRVTVVRNPVPAAGGSTITKDCFIEGISWSITPNYWDVSFQLSPISSLPFYDSAVILDPVSYWRMDEAT